MANPAVLTVKKQDIASDIGPSLLIPSNGKTDILVAKNRGSEPLTNSMLAADQWDRAVLEMGGDLLQSWRWGEFRRRQGWDVERVSGKNRDGKWMAQVCFKKSGPVSAAYIPNGPLLTGDHQRVFPLMMANIDEVCRKHRAVTLIIDPIHPFELPGTFKDRGFVKWRRPVRPRYNWHALMLPDDQLMDGMNATKRKRIRQSIRAGLTLENWSVTKEKIDTFYQMLMEITALKKIPCFSYSYVADQIQSLGDHGELLCVTQDGTPLAASIFARFGDEATYLLAAASVTERGTGAGAYLIYEAIRRYRDLGCTRLDMGSIRPDGLRDFKTAFSGVEVNYPPSMERRYSAALSLVTRRVMEHRYRYG